MRESTEGALCNDANDASSIRKPSRGCQAVRGNESQLDVGNKSYAPYNCQIE